jgi:hypothetical protein
MPVAWGRHDRRRIFLNVAILNAADAAIVQRGGHVLKTQMFKALVDTGATGTCITKAAAEKIGLAPIGKVEVQGVSGTKEHNNYLFYVGFTTPMPGAPIAIAPSAQELQVQVQVHMVNVPIQGAEFDAGAQGGFDVLLGMDVISTGSLKIEGDGTFSWSW